MANMSDVMWFPDVFVSNTLSANPARVDMREQRLTVSSDGHVTLRRRFIDRVNCHLKLRDMPFDHQRLAVQVGSFGGAIDLHRHIIDFRAAGRTNSAEIEIGRHVNSVERLLAAVDHVSASEISPA